MISATHLQTDGSDHIDKGLVEAWTHWDSLSDQLIKIYEVTKPDCCSVQFSSCKIIPEGVKGYTVGCVPHCLQIFSASMSIL